MNEKKWFVYLSDHHEGPFSLDELKEKVEINAISASSYVWKEGMADWLVAADLPELNVIFGAPPLDAMSASHEPTLVGSKQESDMTYGERPGFENLEVNSVPQEDAHSKDFAEIKQKNTLLRFVLPLLVVGISGVTAFLFVTGKGAEFFRTAQGGVSALSGIRDYIQPYAHRLGDRIPQVFQWFPPLKEGSHELSDADRDELNALFQQTIDSSAPKLIDVKFTKTNQGFRVWATSWLPDGAALDLRLEGLADTLLNTLSSNKTLQMSVQGKVAQSPEIRGLPQGEYWLTVKESNQQSEAVKSFLANFPPVVTDEGQRNERVYFRKKVFLLTEEESSYRAKLQAYHEKLINSSNADLQELQQFRAVLSSSLEETEKQYHRLRQVKNRKLSKRQMDDFVFKRIRGVRDELSRALVVAPEGAQLVQRIYPKGFLLAADAMSQIFASVDLMVNFFNSRSDVRSYDIRVGESVAKAGATLVALQKFISDVQAAPKLPSGVTVYVSETPSP